MKLHIENLTLNVHPQRALMADALLKAVMHTSAEIGDRANLALPRLGKAWDEQRGSLVGLCPGGSESRDYALILPFSAKANLGERAWGERGKDIPGAKHDIDGLANTKAMAEAGNSLAKDILGMEVDGMSGLYLPARHEARMAFLITADKFDKTKLHWTSTQSGALNAWGQDFDVGGQSSNSKNYEFVFRLVRRVFL